MSDARQKVDAINAMSAMAFMDDMGIKANFIDKNMKLNGTDLEDAEQFYEQQALYLKKVIQGSWKADKQDNYLGNCTTFSLYATFMDMAVWGDILSFNPDDKLCYVELTNVKAGRTGDGQDIWEKRAKLVISPYGELAIRIQYGQIKHADPVIIVREGDIFELGTDERCNVMVIWKSKIIGDNTRPVVASFVKITRPDNSFVIKYMLREDVERLAAYSKKKNSGKWINPLYGDNFGNVDTGFLRAKTLKHAFAGVFPRLKVKGTNTKLDEMSTDDVDLTLPANAMGSAAPPEASREPAPTFTRPPAPAVNPDDSWDKPSGYTGSTTATPAYNNQSQSVNEEPAF